MVAGGGKRQVAAGGGSWRQVVVGGSRWWQVVTGGGRWWQVVAGSGRRWQVVDRMDGSYRCSTLSIHGCLTYFTIAAPSAYMHVPRPTTWDVDGSIGMPDLSSMPYV